MKKYITYLIKDLQIGQQAAYSSVMDAYSYSYPLRRTVVAEDSIGRYIGIPQSAFPPVERLDQQQLTAVLKEMKQVLQLLRLHIHFPSGLSPARQYELLIELWDQSIPLEGHKKQYLDFCSMEPHQCPYGTDFCYCQQTPDDWESL